LRQLLHM